MKIFIKLKANSHFRKIENFGNGRYLVYIPESPEKANEELLKILSKYLGIPEDQIKIKVGFGEENKVLEIP